MISPIKLPMTHKKNGFTYTQIKRGEKVCIYRQHYSDDLNYYEVFLIKVKPATSLFGKNFPAREAFPNNEAFGDWAWTYRSLEGAIIKFEELEGQTNKAEAIKELIKEHIY